MWNNVEDEILGTLDRKKKKRTPFYDKPAMLPHRHVSADNATLIRLIDDRIAKALRDQIGRD